MTVSVDAVVYFNVIDAELALCSVDDFRSVLKYIFFMKHLARPFPKFSSLYPFIRYWYKTVIRTCLFENLLIQPKKSKPEAKIRNVFEMPSPISTDEQLSHHQTVQPDKTKIILCLFNLNLDYMFN